MALIISTCVTLAINNELQKLKIELIQGFKILEELLQIFTLPCTSNFESEISHKITLREIVG